MDWATDGTLTGRNQAPTFTPTATQPTSGSAIPSNGCGAVTTLRLETYPNLNAYDPWSGTFGGTNSQLTSGKAPFPNFGAVPVPSVGATPPGSAYPAFRITGNIIASTPIPNDRVITDMFQVGCEAPDVCIQMVPSSTGAPVGGFVTGKYHGGTWTGSVSWPGRYQVYVKDCPTGWSPSNVCSGDSNEIVGFVDISDGNVPTWDLDASCFGILNCQYLKGGPIKATGGFHPLTPTRILDTRTFTGITNGAVRRGDGRLPLDPSPVNRIAETKNHDLKVTGVAGIPAYGVSAVLLNITAVQPPGGDWVSVFPRPPSIGIYDNQGTYATDPPANTSNLNLTKGETVPNLVLAPVGAGGTIRIWNASVSGMHIIADVAGWFDTGAPSTSAGGLRFTGIAPLRLLDTRPTPPGTNNRFQPLDDRELLVADNDPDTLGVPADAQSVVLNVTSVEPTGTGFVTVYPNGEALPNASNLNVNPGITRSNLVVVKVGTDGKIRLNVYGTDMDIIVDIFGYYGGTGGGLTTAITPVRVADTRSGLGTPAGRFGPGEARNIQVADVFGIPAGVTAIVINVTAANTDNGGYLTVWPKGLAQPASSNLNWDPGRNTPNLVIVGVSADGYISIYNAVGGNSSVIVDVFGYVI